MRDCDLYPLDIPSEATIKVYVHVPNFEGSPDRLNLTLGSAPSSKRQKNTFETFTHVKS